MSGAVQKQDNVIDADDGEEELALDGPSRKRKKLDRDAELSDRKSIRDKLVKLYEDIEKAFVNQSSRSDDQLDYWDAYNCMLGPYQSYSGNAQIFLPIIHDAIEARKTRFVNMLFPRSGRYVDVVSTDGEEPYALTALLEGYVRAAHLRTEVAPALSVAGDVEGQYNVYISWSETARHVVWKTRKPVTVLGAELDGVDDIEDIEEDVLLDGHPTVEVLPDADVVISPVTANSVEEALEQGGFVAILRRWTKEQLRRMGDSGETVRSVSDSIIENMSSPEKQGEKDVRKHHADAAGIKVKGTVCQGYEVWTKLKVDGEKRLCRVYYGGAQIVLGAKLNPYWCDRCPLISKPVKKVPGLIKGQSLVQPVAMMQYGANDAINEGMDSATYALLPIIMTDPLKNPKIGTMVLDLAAVWETSPNDTRFAQFPELWRGAFEIVAGYKNQIFQTLSVSPAMMPQSTGGRSKRNQAEMANEQQVEILSTADAVTVQEDVYTDIITWFAEMDSQFRTDAITVKAYGNLGMRAAMERIEPIQLGKKWSFVWFGVEQARNAAQIQQQIALLNVIAKIPPQMLPGRKLNMVPVIEIACMAAYGPRIAPLVFIDQAKEFSYEPEMENTILGEGHFWPVSPMDDHNKHVKSHTETVQKTGDPTGCVKAHIALHRMAMIQAAMVQQQMMLAQQGQIGAPPVRHASPRPGGQATMPRQMKSPAGAIAPDRMGGAGAVVMPRKM